MHLIVAAAINGKFEVWKTCSSVLSPIDDAKPTLMGFTSQLYQHVANKLHATELPVNQTMLVGLRILELAGQSCTCVDRPYSAVLVHGGPFVEFDDALLAEFTQSVTVFGAALDRLLLACADTSLTTREFMRTFREFRTTAHQLRKDYLQTVGEIDFRKRKETAGFGYGISFTPLGHADYRNKRSSNGKNQPGNKGGPKDCQRNGPAVTRSSSRINEREGLTGQCPCELRKAVRTLPAVEPERHFVQITRSSG